MKIALTSDIHLEFGTISFQNNDETDVLILSGDICVAKDFNKPESDAIKNFFEDCCSKFKNVVYVMGNHEHYNGDFAKTIPTLKGIFAHLKNLHILDKEYVIIDDVVFFGGTLWTDMNKEDPNTLWGIKQRMNDFRCVENSNRMVNYKVPVYDKEDPNKRPVDKTVQRAALFSPEDTVEDHKAFIAALKSALAEHDKPFVVVGHHAPSKQSTHPRYKHEQLVNGAYSSDLSEFILDNPKIKIWTHGHTHEEFDYMLGSTRILCNPRGYVYYERGSQEEDPYYPLVVNL